MCIFVDSTNTVKWMTINIGDETCTFPENGPQKFRNASLFCYTVENQDFYAFTNKFGFEQHDNETNANYVQRIYCDSSKFVKKFPEDRKYQFEMTGCNVVLNKSLKHVGLTGSYHLYAIRDTIDLQLEMNSLKVGGCTEISYRRYLALTTPRQFVYTVKYVSRDGYVGYKMYGDSLSKTNMILIHKGKV